MKSALVLITCLLAAAHATAEDRLITLDGLTYNKTIRTIDAAGSIRFADDSKPAALDALRRIERTLQPAAPPQNPVRLLTTGGSTLLVTTLIIDDHRVQFARSQASTASWPLHAVRAVVFVDPPADSRGRIQFDPLFTQTLDDTAERQDHLLVIREGQLIIVPGALVSLDAAEATFIWNDQPRKIDRDQLYAITFAASDSSPPPAPHKLQLADGSLLLGRIQQLSDATLTLQFSADRSIDLPWDEITRIDVRSDRLTFLSDLEPVESRTQAIVTYPWPAQRDASVMGSPLQLAGIIYDKGLGVHARTTLRYAIEGDYDQFAATIGIDDNSPAGDCIFIILADGRQLLNQRMTSADNPRKIVFDIPSVKILELIVDPGENLDIADHADWADARLIRNEN